MTTSEKYVTAAFLVLLATVLLYVIIYAFKMRRLEREVAELEARAKAEARALGAPSERQSKTATPVNREPGASTDAERAPEPVR